MLFLFIITKLFYNEINLQEFYLKGRTFMEFGEKLKKAREGKGITQQTLANQLYVTRQAVSRWECGARFPDLLTAKKIAEILEVSLDELLSGEETIKCAEENPIIESPSILRVQTALYGFAAMAFLFILIYYFYGFITLETSDAFAYSLTFAYTFTDVSMTLLMFWGLYLSVREKLSPKKTAILPILYCVMEVVTKLIIIYNVSTQIGPLSPKMMITHSIDILLPTICVLFLFKFFFHGKQAWRFGIYAFFIEDIIMNGISYVQARLSPIDTDLGFFVGTIRLLANLAFAGLILYQTYTLYKKRCHAASNPTSLR